MSKIHHRQGADILTIESGGAINVLSGGAIKANGTQASAIASLTDSTGGSADSTLQAIPNPADTPASADALRDDLVTNTLPAIRNDLADLAAKVNLILASLRGAGIIDS